MRDQVTRLLELLTEEEAKLLLSKTSFGRVELKTELGACKINALGRLTDELRAELKDKDG